MSTDPATAPTPPTWADVLALVAKLDSSGLADAEIVMDGVSVRVSRSVLPSGTQPRPESVAPTEQPALQPAPQQAAAASSGPPTPTPAESSVAASGPAVTAPMLGVIYLRPSPDAEPFVKVGDLVTPDTTVAIVEVMKMMNTVVAGAQGTVADICVKDGQLVEHGDVLIRLETV